MHGKVYTEISWNARGFSSTDRGNLKKMLLPGAAAGMFKKSRKMGRQGRVHIQGRNAAAGRNAQAERMEQQALEFHCFGKGFIEGEIPVFVIAQYGRAGKGHVAADLMHPAACQLQFQNGKNAEAGFGKPSRVQRRVPGFGAFTFSPDFNVHAYNARTGLRRARAYCQILFGGGTLPYQPRVARRGRFVFGNENYAGCVPVKPVYQQGPGRIGTCQQGIQ